MKLVIASDKSLSQSFCADISFKGLADLWNVNQFRKMNGAQRNTALFFVWVACWLSVK